MMKKLALLLVLALPVTAEIDFINMVCLSDSTGRIVRIWGTDSAKVLKDVVLVTLGSGGYTVTFKNGKMLTLPKPTYQRMEQLTEDTTSEVKSPRRRDETKTVPDTTRSRKDKKEDR